MFELNVLGIYVLTMAVCLVFVMVLLSRQKRTGKDVAVWLFAGIVGIMLGTGGTLSVIYLSGYQVVEDFEVVQDESADAEMEDSEDGEGGSGGRGGGGRGGGRGGFNPSAIFAQRDADGDGKLTGDEISDRMAESLEEIDTDGDGSVTLEEFEARLQSRSGGRGPRRGGPDGGEGPAGSRDGSDGDSSEDRPDQPQGSELEE